MSALGQKCQKTNPREARSEGAKLTSEENNPVAKSDRLEMLTYCRARA